MALHKDFAVAAMDSATLVEVELVSWKKTKPDASSPPKFQFTDVFGAPPGGVGALVVATYRCVVTPEVISM